MHKVGIFALALQLVTGCLSTHDIELGELAPDSGDDAWRLDAGDTGPEAPEGRAPEGDDDRDDPGEAMSGDDDDPTTPDAGIALDAGASDAAQPDAAESQEDAGPRDAGPDARPPSDAGNSALSILCMREPWHCL